MMCNHHHNHHAQPPKYLQHNNQWESVVRWAALSSYGSPRAFSTEGLSYLSFVIIMIFDITATNVKINHQHINVWWDVLSILGFPEFEKVVATSSSWSASSKWDAPFPPFAWAAPPGWWFQQFECTLHETRSYEWPRLPPNDPWYENFGLRHQITRCRPKPRIGGAAAQAPTTPPPPPVLGMSDLATENLDLTGFERAVGILWTSSGFPRHPLASKMWWWWTLMDSGQLATVARTDLIKSDLHGSDQSTELVWSRHFDISVHRVQSRFILGLMTSGDGIFKVGAIWYPASIALTWIWGTNMEQVECISILLSCL